MQNTTRSSNLTVIECHDVPETHDPACVYRLLPNNPDDRYYWERVDRNIGWITKEEQMVLKNSVVGIAGCGGMGSAAAERMLRVGIGEIRFADGETFEISNINRQLAARRNTVGQNKAMATARALRAITDDTTLVAYPQGICKETAEHFVEGCDVIIDEIEFWELAAPMYLHRAARKAGISIFGCNTCGWGAHLFLFTPESMQIEEAFGVTLEQAENIDHRMHEGTIPRQEKEALLRMLTKVVAPSLQEYSASDPRCDLNVVINRLLEEGVVPIISTNPTFATGFVADRVILHLLRDSGVKRDIIEVPPMPGYLYLDAARMKAEVVIENQLTQEGAAWTTALS